MRRRGIAELVRRAILSDAATLSLRFVRPQAPSGATGNDEWRVAANGSGATGCAGGVVRGATCSHGASPLLSFGQHALGARSMATARLNDPALALQLPFADDAVHEPRPRANRGQQGARVAHQS